jgi:hypothetical protein
MLSLCTMYKRIEKRTVEVRSGINFTGGTMVRLTEDQSSCILLYVYVDPRSLDDTETLEGAANINVVQVGFQSTFE